MPISSLIFLAGVLFSAAIFGAEKSESGGNTLPKPARADDTSNPSRTQTDHWSLQPVKSPPLPSVKNLRWPCNAVDCFILARLEKAALTPSPEAERAILIRRLSYDLLGLPPTPKEIDAFIDDKHPQAYERLVEHLLASPRYGERWGRHWLDVARYTESQGFEYDRLRDNAWHYRDYVIASFNADKPYDQFVKEQIAGDAIKPFKRDGIVATSLLVCGPWDQAGNSQANQTQKAITREEELEDLISVVSQTFLGLTVNCARCHAHKFDPIPQEDYYRFKSVFEGVRHGERPIVAPEEIKAHDERVANLKTQIAELEKQIGKLDSNARSALLAKRQTNFSTSIPGPTPFARWTFATNANDVIGSLPGTLHGGASIANGRLRLNGNAAFLKTAPLPKDITEKTLEAWVSLATLDQAGGGVISIESNDGSNFDAIVFGERQPKKWMAGSGGFARSRNLDALEETASPNGLIHVAIVYRADNSVAVFRNGEPYGQPYTPTTGLQTFRANESRVLLGMRHTGGGKPFLAGEIELAVLYDRALTAQEVAASFRASGLSISPEEMLACLSDAQRNQREKALAQLNRSREELKAVPNVPVSYAGTREQPKPTHRLKRGDVKSPAEEMTPGALSAIAEPDPNFGLDANAPEAERRLKLAAWIADRRNPLTARVMVNRVWHYHFGQGLVTTPNDLGESGAKPSHPELIDWLASYFMDHGWSVKELHRIILNSATYRQASGFNKAAVAIDADNQLLWRFTPRRSEGEAVRDAMLAISGEINLAQGGPSFRPFDTKEFNATFYLIADKTGPQFNRRTVYRMNVNSGKDPLLDSLDCPDPSVKTPSRGRTTTPLQALGLMNNSFVQRQAQCLAERVTKEAGGDGARAIRLAYRYAFGRGATAAETKRAVVIARENGLQTVCWALLNATEFLYVK